MTRKLEAYFTDYKEDHSTRGNQICHYIGIPMIVVSLLGLLSLVTFGSPAFVGGTVRPDLGLLLVLFGILWTFSVDWKIAIPYGVFIFGLYCVGRSLPLGVLIAVQIIGWTIQLIGHAKYEKRSPALTRNFVHTLVGPLWIFSKAVGYAKT